MLLRDHLERSGALCFRWRSDLPMAFLPLMALALRRGAARRWSFMWATRRAILKNGPRS